MEPFTMMLGYGLVNSLSQLVVRPLADKLSASGRQQEMRMQMETKHALDLEAVRLNKQIELENQKNIQSYCHNFRLLEAQKQFEKQLQMWQIGKFNDAMWPLLTPYDHPSLHPNCTSGGQAPINVFLATTDPRSPFSSLIQPDLKNRLSKFLQTAYLNDPYQQHPCICRIGDWKGGFQDAAFINALWYGMQGQPTIVVNPIQTEFGETLDLDVSIWGLGETGYSPKTQNVLSGSFASALGRIKRDKTKSWIDCGLPAQSKEMLHNIDLLKQEEKIKEAGNVGFVDKLLIQYKLPLEIQTEVITAFSNEYNHLISCITGLYADIYHLIEYGAEPYMPIAINQYNLATGGSYQIPDVAIQHYKKALTNMVCTNYLQDKIPSAFLGVAKSLCFNPKESLQIFQEGVGFWANKKLDLKSEVEIPRTIDECIGLLYDKSTDNDKHYLEQAKDVLIAMNLPEAANSLTRKISILVEKPIQQTATKETEVEWEVTEKETFTDVDFMSWINAQKAVAVRQGAVYALVQLRDTYFVMIFLDDNARVINNEKIGGKCIIAQRYYFTEEILNNDILIYNLLENKYKSKIELMEKKEFDSFERLGKQLDVLVNNLGRFSRPTKVTANAQKGTETKKEGFEGQLIELFASSNILSLESENCSIAEFKMIKDWITSKLPINGAVKAHVFRTNVEGKIMLCIFFSDADSNTLIGNNYPMKRIVCEKCDSDIEAFLNGLSLGTINL